MGQVDAEQLCHAGKGCGDRPYAPVDSTRAQRELHHLTHQPISKANAHSSAAFSTHVMALSQWSEGPSRRGPQVLSANTVRNVSVAKVIAARAALVSARASSMTKSWMMAWKRSAVTGTPASRSLSA